MQKFFDSKKDESFPAFIPKKRLGQNFLVSQKVLNGMLEAIDPEMDETILEIGPGQGALTKYVLPHVGKLIAVEADKQLAEGLRNKFQRDNFELHMGDFLKFDLSQMPDGIKVIGNLPYYISTPIIEKVIEWRHKFRSLHMTVQYEFGQRLIAKPGTKAYGSFTCFVNYFAKPTMLFKIAPRSFQPAPKVVSCFMFLQMRDEPAVQVKDEKFFLSLIKNSFLQRRKTIPNALGMMRSKDVLEKALKDLDINSRARAENLTLEDFARLSDALGE